MKNLSIKFGNKSRGFTLIEIMIVVAIIGILASVAIANYSEYIIRANRADAKDKLSEVMFEMERFNTRNRTYTTDLQALGYTGIAANAPLPTDRRFYQITAVACAGIPLRRCVNLQATPVAGGRQATDGALTIDSRGAKTGKWDKERGT